MQQQGVAILAKTGCVAVGTQSAEFCPQGPLSSPKLPFLSPTKAASDLLLSLSFDTAKVRSPLPCLCSELGALSYLLGVSCGHRDGDSGTDSSPGRILQAVGRRVFGRF